ncbi:hypothetical protein [Massilia glaciei]|uniref:STAS/SEC14 domain-containing protein n=1 Tax=Massilia glaciei TaxID=1524097 RepID=A0A2U2HPA3_9BURK|nr:hypothetical protein [Massilia glaciei]PWF49338.1 hypothetical protein C7C56_006840 [Massilia glaciei]
MSKFRPHGNYKLRLDGRILVSDLQGPWNLELVDAWMRAAYPMVKELAATGPHVHLTVVTGSLLCTPESLDRLTEVIVYTTAHMKCVGNPVVAAAEVEGRALFEPMYARIYDGSPPRGLFYDIETAKTWALELLAKEGF